MPALNDHSRIQPLPAEVAAQIKSSTAIVSLNGVVLELVKNSLDAKATKVGATVDFARGGCVVEDDGLGISPAEFREDGGLGKLYYTSKYRTGESLLGRHGTFLASLASMCLLSITSRSHTHRSLNALTYHHAKTVDRQLPAPAHSELHTKHGTRVSARNLFGNMPVRVKQRSKITEQKPEQERMWNALKRDVTALLLGWQGCVSLKIRDGDNRIVIAFNTSSSIKPASSRSSAHTSTSSRSSSTQLSCLLNILTQGGYITVDEWSSWVPASASTSSLSIRGAISLDPAPGRHVQFISLGMRPILADSGHNELYNEVNRLFASSDFGTIEDEESVTTKEKSGQQSATLSRSKIRKDIDRYPMFHLRVTIKGDDVSEENVFSDDTSLQNILDVLHAMIVQWLSVHHFRPRQVSRTRPSKTTTSENEPGRSISPRKRSRPMSQPREDPTSKRDDVFARWSRIKTARPELFRTSSTPKSSSTTQLTFSPLAMEPGIQQSASGDSIPNESMDIEEGDTTADNKESGPDGIISWTDPTTNKTYLLNSRTGCVLPDRSSHTSTAAKGSYKAVQRSLRLRPSTPGSDRPQAPWLDNVLQTWDNPVFETNAAQIPQVPLEDIGLDPCCRNRRGDFSSFKNTKLSKDGLQHSTIVAQIDKKFILVKMPVRATADDRESNDSELLVLIDQHAADERIRVETLLQDLCKPSESAHQSTLGHRSQVASTILGKPIQFSVSNEEQKHFTTFAANFAAWGILYDVISSSNATISHKSALLSVISLPPAISERCKADPPLLISLLRETVWGYVETPPLPPSTLLATSLPSGNVEDDASWVRALSSCPKSLVDLVNSRACRSAIMFNDELSMEECTDLVERLGKCVFPFMCAHGRPSMVPLVGLGGVGVADSSTSSGLGVGLSTSLDRTQAPDTEFLQAYKAWTSKA